jgi:hypothetical protein
MPFSGVKFENLYTAANFVYADNGCAALDGNMPIGNGIGK